MSKNNKTTSENNSSSSETAVHAEKENKESKKSMFSRRTLLIVFAALFALVFLVYFLLIYSDDSVRVGDVVITEDEFGVRIDAYSSFYGAMDPDADSEDVERMARDALILHTALLQEAEQRGIDIEPGVRKLIESNAEAHDMQEDDFFAYMETTFNFSEGDLRFNYELEVLQDELAHHLIQNRDVLSVLIRYDMIDENLDDAQSRFDQRKNHLESTVLPWFDSGLSTDEIKKQADVSKFNDGFAGDDSAGDDSGKNIVAGIDSNLNRERDPNHYESSVDWDAVYSLEQVGDYTEEAIKSTAGYFVLYRLESISDGEFLSWEDYTDYVKSNADIFSIRVSLTDVLIGAGLVASHHGSSPISGGSCSIYQFSSVDDLGPIGSVTNKIFELFMPQKAYASPCPAPGSAHWTGWKGKVKSTTGMNLSGVSVKVGPRNPPPHLFCDGSTGKTVTTNAFGNYDTGRTFSCWMQWEATFSKPGCTSKTKDLTLHKENNGKYGPNINATLSCVPPPDPYTVRSNMIQGGSSGGGGSDMTGTFSANHSITQSGSSSSSSSSSSALSFNGDTSNTNNISVRAPFSVTDSSGRVWERQGSNRCYSTSGTCRNSGVQSGSAGQAVPRTFSTSGIVSNGGTVRVYWFYELKELFWNYTHRIFTVANSTTGTPGATNRHRQGSTVAITNQLRNTGDGDGMTANHRIQVRIGSGSWENAPNPSGNRSSWSQSAISAGSNGTSRSYSYTIPNDLANGTRICFKAQVSPFRGMSIPSLNATGHGNGSGTGWRDSTVRCIQAYTPPPDFNISANCQQISVTGLNLYGRSMSDVTITVGGTTVSDTSTFTGNSATFTYPRFGQTKDTENVVVSITNDLSGPNTTGSRNTTAGPCYIGSCSLDINSPHSGNEVFVQNSLGISNEYTTRAAYGNTGGMDWMSDRVRINFDVNHGSTPSLSLPSMLALARSGNGDRTFTGFTAGATLAQHNVDMVIQYQDDSNNWVDFVDCDVQFDPYTKFELAPKNINDELSPTRENPTQYNLNWMVDLEFNPTVSGTPSTVSVNNNAKRNMSASNATVNPTSFPAISTFPVSPYTDSASVDDFEMGSEFCANLTLDYTEGWINGNDTIPTWTLAVPFASGSLCQTVQDWPYVSVFGADVMAAGDFGVENCDASTPLGSDTGVIRAFFDSSGNRGSGSQFATVAVNTISQFSSAKMRAPTSETSFANDTGGYGGNYPGAHCINDYYANHVNAQEITTGNFVSLINSEGTGSYKVDFRQTPGSGAATTTVRRGDNITMYHEGDFYLGKNVSYQEGWNSLADIPSFMLVVRGDLYIGSNVTNLDGLYVAQPIDESNGGNIFTCSTRNNSGPSAVFSVVTGNNLVNECDKALTVNGAFVAKGIIFNRYGGSSLRYGTMDEYVYDEPDPDRCASTVAGDRSVCAAEVINFSPELYLANPSLPVERGPGVGVYDSLTSLPPLF